MLCYVSCRLLTNLSCIFHQCLCPFVIFQILKSENVEFVVAPYEADAQLAYLSSLEAEEGGIAAVITEDSDLLAYGCQAVRTSAKL